MRILNYTGKNVRLYKKMEYDSDHKCYVEGEHGRPYIEFPSKGILEARSEAPRNGSERTVNCNGVSIPMKLYPKWIDVDALPIGNDDECTLISVAGEYVRACDDDEFTLFIVTDEYVRACEYLGIPTTKLLTVGPAVVDEDNWTTVLGYAGLTWHTFDPEPEIEKTDEPSITIRNLTPNEVVIYAGAEYDSAINKYRGGVKRSEFSPEGKILPIKMVVESSELISDLFIGNDGNPFPIRVAVETKYGGIKTLDGKDWEPDLIFEPGEYAIVSEDCIRECYRRGIGTIHLLTVGDPVVDVDGHTVIGYTHLVHH